MRRRWICYGISYFMLGCMFYLSFDLFLKWAPAAIFWFFGIVFFGMGLLATEEFTGGN